MPGELEKLPWLKNHQDEPPHLTMSDVIKLVVFGTAAVLLVIGVVVG
jgi:hypothetical protein